MDSVLLANGATITLHLGDITAEHTDAIVNAANAHLRPGGGVCGAIHAAAGPQLAAECARIVARTGPLATGDAAITSGYGLPARHVIHAVGPVWHGGASGEGSRLASAYRSAITVAGENGLASIAFPSISTGIFGYPVVAAAPIALRAVAGALEHAPTVRQVVFVLFDQGTFATYSAAMDELRTDS